MATCGQCVAASDVVDLFVKAPRSVLPLLEQSTRLDMVDYFRSGMSTPSANVMDGHARVTDMTGRALTLQVSDAMTVQMVLLPVNVKQEVICCIFTLKTPQPDSWIEFYSTDWTKIGADKYFKAPTLDDWITKGGQKQKNEIQEQFPFILASYTCSYPDNSTGCELVLTNQMESYMGQEQYDEFGPLLYKQLTYVWTGKMFKRK
ncbi:MAG: DUF3256 family protein [Muribaculaceae bacterium]|nr:DUF3256 family protein [Muribaculaceae bacterium]